MFYLSVYEHLHILICSIMCLRASELFPVVTLLVYLNEDADFLYSLLCAPVANFSDLFPFSFSLYAHLAQNLQSS